MKEHTVKEFGDMSSKDAMAFISVISEYDSETREGYGESNSTELNAVCSDWCLPTSGRTVTVPSGDST